MNGQFEGGGGRIFFKELWKIHVCTFSYNLCILYIYTISRCISIILKLESYNSSFDGGGGGS